MRLLDIELKRKPPSYTVDTCRALRSEHKHSSIAILLGSDSLWSLERWRRIEELLQYHSFWIFPRLDSMQAGEIESLCSKIKSRFTSARFEVLWNSPRINCSSSHLRKFLSQGASRGQDDCLLPQVLEYIQRRNLYRVG